MRAQYDQSHDPALGPHDDVTDADVDSPLALAAAATAAATTTETTAAFVTGRRRSADRSGEVALVLSLTLHAMVIGGTTMWWRGAPRDAPPVATVRSGGTGGAEVAVTPDDPPPVLSPPVPFTFTQDVDRPPKADAPWFEPPPTFEQVATISNLPRGDGDAPAGQPPPLLGVPPSADGAVPRPPNRRIPRPQGDTEGIVGPVASDGNRAPIYPPDARRRREEGTVTLHVRIDADGRVVSVSISRGSGFTALDDAAVRAVASWTYTPMRRDGATTACEVDLPVRFVLRRGA